MPTVIMLQLDVTNAEQVIIAIDAIRQANLPALNPRAVVAVNSMALALLAGATIAGLDEVYVIELAGEVPT